MKKCPICGSIDIIKLVESRDHEIFCSCGVCGNYCINWSNLGDDFNKNYLLHYMSYNGYMPNSLKYSNRYLTNVALTENHRSFISENNLEHWFNSPVLFDEKDINAWYPRRLSERIDYILLKVHKELRHIGNVYTAMNEAFYSLMFADRYDQCGDIWLTGADRYWSEQALYLYKCL